MVHCGKSHAERVVPVKACPASRLARHGRIEGAIQDSPRPVRGWCHQDPKGQPEAHSRRLLSGLIVAAISAYAAVAVRNPALRTPTMIRSPLIEITVGIPNTSTERCAIMLFHEDARQDERHVTATHFRNHSGLYRV